MPDPVEIDDSADLRIADYIGLKDAAARRGRVGAADGILIAEGALVLPRLLESAYPLRSVLLTPQRFPAVSGLLAGVRAPVYLAPQAVMNAAVGFNIHRGVLASADRRPFSPVASVLSGARRVAVLENIRDHENLGVLLRSAAAFGVTGILLSPECCDPLYRRSVRVSMGYALGLAFGVVSPWPAGLVEVREAGFRVVALSPAPAAVDIRDLSLGAADRVALLLGEEGPGLSGAALGEADVIARIAMAPGVDSLNVAAAATVAFHAAQPAPLVPHR